mmetsp:Transcript_18042/g.45139  ORF Transcript_18042/g.45139 Transcript_18042/m.45139 type:complete len:620 (+) Transcript_18042:238-2097(+)
MRPGQLSALVAKTARAAARLGSSVADYLEAAGNDGAATEEASSSSSASSGSFRDPLLAIDEEVTTEDCLLCYPVSASPTAQIAELSTASPTSSVSSTPTAASPEQQQPEDQVESEESEKCCAICLRDFEPGQALLTTQCGHQYHALCLIQAWQRRPHCPLCREYIDSTAEGSTTLATAISTGGLATAGTAADRPSFPANPADYFASSDSDALRRVSQAITRLSLVDNALSTSSSSTAGGVSGDPRTTVGSNAPINIDPEHQGVIAGRRSSTTSSGPSDVGAGASRAGARTAASSSTAAAREILDRYPIDPHVLARMRRENRRIAHGNQPPFSGASAAGATTSTSTPSTTAAAAAAVYTEAGARSAAAGTAYTGCIYADLFLADLGIFSNLGNLSASPSAESLSALRMEPDEGTAAPAPPITADHEVPVELELEVALAVRDSPPPQSVAEEPPSQADYRSQHPELHQDPVAAGLRADSLPRLTEYQHSLLRGVCMAQLIDELFQYASVGHYEAVQQILRSGFLDVKSARDVCGNTVLHFARNLDIVKLCVETYHADVNAVNDVLWTPLHWASECENPALVWTLLQYGADHTLYTNCSRTARELATSPAVLSVFDSFMQRG